MKDGSGAMLQVNTPVICPENVFGVTKKRLAAEPWMSVSASAMSMPVDQVATLLP